MKTAVTHVEVIEPAGPGRPSDYSEALTDTICERIGNGESLRRVCERLGIAPAEVMAFGDAQNDMSMLDFAGYGVAMGNACAELKAMADEVTLSNNEDGIAVSLAKHFGV